TERLSGAREDEDVGFAQDLDRLAMREGAPELYDGVGARPRGIDESTTSSGVTHLPHMLDDGMSHGRSSPVVDLTDSPVEALVRTGLADEYDCPDQCTVGGTAAVDVDRRDRPDHDSVRADTVHCADLSGHRSGGYDDIVCSRNAAEHPLS